MSLNYSDPAKTLAQINFHGRDWSLFKQYLEEQRDISMRYLCSDIGFEEVNKVKIIMKL
jgi:hypothetical protein